MWLGQNSHCHIYHRENLAFTGTIEMLYTEGFLTIFSNSLSSIAGIVGHLQGRTKQIILPEQRQFVCQKAFPLESSRLQGIFLMSMLSSLFAWKKKVLQIFCNEPENKYAKIIFQWHTECSMSGKEEARTLLMHMQWAGVED